MFGIIIKRTEFKLKILVTYFSLSGNTKKIAQAIYEELSSCGKEVYMKDLADITPIGLDEFDLVFLGSACHDADIAEPLKLFLGYLPNSPSFKMAGFVTHATTMPEGGKRNRELYQQWAGNCEETLGKISQQKGIDLIGYFHCQGIPSPPIAEFIHQEIIQEEDEWEDYYNEVRQHPNDVDLLEAKAFARNVLACLISSGKEANCR